MTYLSDLLANRLHLLKGLLADVAHLLGNLALLFPLPQLLHLFGSQLLFGLLLLLGDVFEQSNLADLVAIVVNDVAVVVNLEANAVAEVTRSESAHDIAVLVTDFTFLVDATAGHWVDPTLLLLRLPPLGLADGVAVLVLDLTVLIDRMADKLLRVALDDTTDDGAIGHNNHAILDNSEIVEAGEGSLWLVVGALDLLCTTNDVSGVVPDLALAVDLLANHDRWVTLSDATDDGTRAVNYVALLVDGTASEDAEVLCSLFLFLPWLGVALGVAELVDNVTILVDGVANKLLGVTFSDDTDNVALGVFDLALFVDTETLETSKRSFGLGNTLVLWQDLAATDDLAGVTVDVSVLVATTTGQLLDVTLNELTDRNLVLIDNEALLVKHLAIQDRVVNRSNFLLFDWLGMALNVTELVDNVTILIDRVADKLLRVALDDLTNDVAIAILDLALLVDTETFETSEWSLRLSDAFFFWEDFTTADDLHNSISIPRSLQLEVYAPTFPVSL